MEYKNYNIEVDREFTLYNIRAIGKGALPKSLQGLFTTSNVAKRLIDLYVDSKTPIKD